MNKKCFLIGYLTGQALRRGVNGSPIDGAGTGAAGISDYDAPSFKAGLAAGLCGAGWMIPYEPSTAKPGDFLESVTTNEIMVDLYSRYAYGKAVAPLFYGMADFAAWLKANNIHNLADFLTYCQAMVASQGGTYSDEDSLEIPALFYVRSYYQEIYKEQTLPVTYGIYSVDAGGELTWDELFDGFGAKASVSRSGWSYTISFYAEAKTGGIEPAGHAPVYRIKSYALVPGKYRFTFSAKVTPPYADAYLSYGPPGPPWVALGLIGKYEKEDNVETNHYYPNVHYIIPGETVEFEIPVNSVEYTYLLATIIPWPAVKTDEPQGSFIGRNVYAFEAGTTTLTISCDLQLLEIYPMKTPNQNAKLTDLMRAIDSLGDYKLYNPTADRLLPSFALVNEYSRLVSKEPDENQMYPAESTETDYAVSGQDSATIHAKAAIGDDGFIAKDIDSKDMIVRNVSCAFSFGNTDSINYSKYAGTSMKDGSFSTWTVWLRKRGAE